MDQRLNLVTLGVADVARSRAFYERLGWQASSFANADVAFFQMGTGVLSLYSIEKLAHDLGAERLATRGGGVTLAWNGRSEAEVDAFMAVATAAGAEIIKQPAPAFWGGYVGYFADPDGHVWEAAFNPHWPLDGEGRMVLPV